MDGSQVRDGETLTENTGGNMFEHFKGLIYAVFGAGLVLITLHIFGPTRETKEMRETLKMIQKFELQKIQQVIRTAAEEEAKKKESKKRGKR